MAELFQTNLHQPRKFLKTDGRIDDFLILSCVYLVGVCNLPAEAKICLSILANQLVLLNMNILLELSTIELNAQLLVASPKLLTKAVPALGNLF
jgi:hypothetical protein